MVRRIRFTIETAGISPGCTKSTINWTSSGGRLLKPAMVVAVDQGFKDVALAPNLEKLLEYRILPEHYVYFGSNVDPRLG